MEKRIFTCFTILLFICCILGISACAVSRPGTMNQLVGTYELKEYTLTEWDNGETQSEGVTTDQIATRNIRFYLIIDGSEYGYVVYGEEGVALTCKQAKITYNYELDDNADSEDGERKYTDKISTFEYATTSKSDSAWLTEHSTLGFMSNNKTLNYKLPHYKWQNKMLVKTEEHNVKFKKVSKATDLSYAEKVLGATLEIIPFQS